MGFIIETRRCRDAELPACSSEANECAEVNTFIAFAKMYSLRECLREFAIE